MYREESMEKRRQNSFVPSCFRGSTDLPWTTIRITNGHLRRFDTITAMTTIQFLIIKAGMKKETERRSVMTAETQSQAMTHRIHRIIALALLAVIGINFQSQAADQPNFLWILSEDNSKHYLKLFDEAGAPTPEIEKLAESGLIFDHTFSCAPVCSVARTTLMSGLYAPRVGTFQHRKIKTATLPDGWQLFPAYLREAGYYTTNRSKTDYNTSGNEGVWDESSNRASWRNRPSPDTPFFHMQTFGQSHES